MARKLVAKARWVRAYDRLPEADQRVVDAVVQRFQPYLSTGEASVGLGIKHLGGRTFEFRAGLALRVVYVIEGECAVLMLLGDHDEVRRFLKQP